MRLTAAQRQQLLSAVRGVFGPTAEVRLFGSRVDDDKRGGDYDVFVETDIEDARELVQRKLQCLARLHATPEFEGEKVDLVVASHIPAAHQSIHDVARREGVLL